jgi:hypothetical protein
MMPTKSSPQGIVRNDSLRSPGGTRKSVRFSFNDRWDPMVKAEDVQLHCPQRARDVQLQPPRRSSDISPKLSRKCNREGSKPRRSRSLLSMTGNKSLAITGLGTEKSQSMNTTTRSNYLIDCALEVVRDSTEYTQINKELISCPSWETHWKSQMILPRRSTGSIFLLATCRPFG